MRRRHAGSDRPLPPSRSPARVRTLAAVEREVLSQPEPHFTQIGVALEVDVLMLHGPPELPDEDVVEGAYPAVHADRDTCALQHAGERLRRELAALVSLHALSCSQCAFSMSASIFSTETPSNMK